MPIGGPQERREFRKNRLAFLARPTLEPGADEPAQVTEASQRYQDRVRAFLARAGRDEEAASRPRKRHRTSAYEWLLLCDNVLRMCTSASGFDHYVVQSSDPRPPLEWPVLKICLDQGSDGWSGGHYLLSKGCCVELSPDMAHGANNDLKGVAKDLGFWQHEVLMGIAYNLNQAPWGSGLRHLQLRETFLAHLETVNPREDLGGCMTPSQSVV